MFSKASQCPTLIIFEGTHVLRCTWIWHIKTIWVVRLNTDCCVVLNMMLVGWITGHAQTLNRSEQCPGHTTLVFLQISRHSFFPRRFLKFLALWIMSLTFQEGSIQVLRHPESGFQMCLLWEKKNNIALCCSPLLQVGRSAPGPGASVNCHLFLLRHKLCKVGLSAG